MSDPVLIASIAAAPALLGLIISLFNRKKIAETAKLVTNISISIDGRMEQLLEVTRGLASAKGHAEGQAQERGEQRDRDLQHQVADKADLIAETVVDTQERVKNIESNVVKVSPEEEEVKLTEKDFPVAR